MAPSWAAGVLAAIVVSVASTANAACSSNLVVDNFANWASNNNSLGGYTSDDKTLTSTSASGGVLTFTPGASSYFYENFPCQAATTNGYGGVTLSVQGPASGSFLVELQSRASCSATTYSSAYYVVGNVTTTARTVTIPFANFTQKTGTPNLNAITSLTFGSFAASGTSWKIGNIAMVCGTARSQVREAERAVVEDPVARGQSHLVDSTLPDLPVLPVQAQDFQATTMLTHLDAQLEARAGGVQSVWGQCGGSGYNGPTSCVATCSCSRKDGYYAQCVPAPTNWLLTSTRPLTTSKTTKSSASASTKTSRPSSSPSLPTFSSGRTSRSLSVSSLVATSHSLSDAVSATTTQKAPQSSSSAGGTPTPQTSAISQITSTSRSSQSSATDALTLSSSSSMFSSQQVTTSLSPDTISVPSSSADNPNGPWTLGIPPLTITSPLSSSQPVTTGSSVTSLAANTSSESLSSSAVYVTSPQDTAPSSSPVETASVTLEIPSSTTQTTPSNSIAITVLSSSTTPSSSSITVLASLTTPSSSSSAAFSNSSLISSGLSNTSTSDSLASTDSGTTTSTESPIVLTSTSSYLFSPSISSTTLLSPILITPTSQETHVQTVTSAPYLNVTSTSAPSPTHYTNNTANTTIQTLPLVGTLTGTKTRSSKTTKSRTTKVGTRTHLIPTSHSPTPTSTGPCQNLLVDDWESQSRLTFLGYNALLGSSSDDGSMQSITVSNHTVRLVPVNASSYFYTELPCVDGNATYGGASLRVKAAKGTKFAVALYSQSTCGGADDEFSNTISTTDLGWDFDGTMQLFSIPFAKFTGFDPGHLSTIFLQTFSGPVTFGPLELYCGTTVQEYVATSTPVPQFTSYSVPAPTGTATPLILESGSSLGSQDTNAAGFWHGGDEGLSVTYQRSHMTIHSNDSDYAWYTTVSDTCADMTTYSMSYLHIQYSGSDKFTVAMQQHNQWCDTSKNPYPETWDSLEAGRYGNSSDMYFPVDHFKINMTRVAGLALKGFYDFGNPTDILKIELVNNVPSGWSVPNKLPSGDLLFACKRPNSFAFAIDDGEPQYAQEVMQTIKDENITVTFFTLGAALDDPTTNLSHVYTEMRDLGHQIATHSFTHPKMEGLPDDGSIDWEYDNDLAVTSDVFSGLKTKYFRPPFGTEGARMRQRLAMSMGVDDPQIVMWSVDVADWIWAETSTPEKQIDAFKSDLAKGGNLVVMHYLYPSTVSYLKTFIQLAKATGKQLMRVDQCMLDPNAPPVPNV